MRAASGSTSSISQSTYSSAPVMLGRNGVRAEPGRDAVGRANSFQLRELGVVVEPVAALPFERRRAVREHRVTMANDGLDEGRPAGRSGRAHRRQDAAPRGEELAVRRPRRTKRELVRTVPDERRMRVAVDETRDGAEPASVDILDVAGERRQGRAWLPPPRSVPSRAMRNASSITSTSPSVGLGGVAHARPPEWRPARGRG